MAHHRYANSKMSFSKRFKVRKNPSRRFTIRGSKMASGSSLVVPMVMWGPRAPTHCISALYLLRDQKTLVSGAADGQVSVSYGL